jgi:hypothetical protein
MCNKPEKLLLMMICIKWEKSMQITPFLQTTAMNSTLCIKQFFLTSLFFCIYLLLSEHFNFVQRPGFNFEAIHVNSTLPTFLLIEFFKTISTLHHTRVITWQATISMQYILKP